MLTDRVAYSPAEAAALLGVTRKHVYALMSRGELDSRLLGGCRRISHIEIERIAGVTQSRARHSLDWARDAGLIDHIENIVANAPPLTADHRHRLAALLAALTRDEAPDAA